jgi:hypothetical protein
LAHQTLLWNGVATPPKPGSGRVDGDLSFHIPVTCVGRQTISVQTAAQHAGAHASTALLQDTAMSHSMPPGFASPSSHNQSTSRPAHPHETSMVLCWLHFCQLDAHINHGFLWQVLARESSGPLAESITTSKSKDINPPTLDLRALSLNRAPGVSKAPRLLLYSTTTSRPPSPPPPILPVKSEEDGMEDLYRLSSNASRQEPWRQRSLSLAGSEPRVLPVLAAKDPHVLAVLEGQELREATRPRRGMRKAQAVYGAGKRHRGFVLVEGLASRWV